MKSEDAAAGLFAGPGMRLEPIIGWNRGILDVAAGKKAEDLISNPEPLLSGLSFRGWVMGIETSLLFWLPARRVASRPPGRFWRDSPGPERDIQSGFSGDIGYLDRLQIIDTDSSWIGRAAGTTLSGRVMPRRWQSWHEPCPMRRVCAVGSCHRAHGTQPVPRLPL